MDVLTPEQRRLNMSRVRGKHTSPELIVRRALHAIGFRFRLHPSGMPGRPDLVLPKWRAVIFVHGCFWHQHDCHLFKLPATRPVFWQEKLSRNAVRDAENLKALHASDWRTLVIWECAVRGRTRLEAEQLLDDCRNFLLSDDCCQAEIRGHREITDSVDAIMR